MNINPTLKGWKFFVRFSRFEPPEFKYATRIQMPTGRIWSCGKVWNHCRLSKSSSTSISYYTSRLHEQRILPDIKYPKWGLWVEDHNSWLLEEFYNVSLALSFPRLLWLCPLVPQSLELEIVRAPYSLRAECSWPDLDLVLPNSHRPDFQSLQPDPSSFWVPSCTGCWYTCDSF